MKKNRFSSPQKKSCDFRPAIFSLSPSSFISSTLSFSSCILYVCLSYLLMYVCIIHIYVHDIVLGFFFFKWLNRLFHHSFLCYSLTHAHRSVGYRNKPKLGLNPPRDLCIYLRVSHRRDSSCKVTPSHTLHVPILIAHTTLSPLSSPLDTTFPRDFPLRWFHLQE